MSQVSHMSTSFSFPPLPPLIKVHRSYSWLLEQLSLLASDASFADALIALRVNDARLT